MSLEIKLKALKERSVNVGKVCYRFICHIHYDKEDAADELISQWGCSIKIPMKKIGTTSFPEEAAKLKDTSTISVLS